MDFSDVTILCVGDLMLDRYAYSDMERISPEAPVPVLRLNHTRVVLGGVGNVANNIAALGGRAVLVGQVGHDAAGASVREALVTTPGIVPDLIGDPGRTTISKTRFIAVNQQVVRFDEESRLPLTGAETEALLAAVGRWIGCVHGVILSDYGKGMLPPVVVGAIIAAARAACRPVFVDPKSRDFSHYRGATCITPNLRELMVASATDVSDEAGMVRAAREVLAQAEADAILVTRSEKGMTLVEADGGTHSVAARAREVFDVSGAGDTVIAAMALMHATGRSLPQAMHVANAAASVVVSKFGTATADIAEVTHELDAHDRQRHGLLATGVQTLPVVRRLVEQWRAQGLSVGLTNGCFDVLHPGHVALLAQARSQCDRLVVALNTDASVQRLKGPTRPINPLEARTAVMAAIRHVDCVLSFDEDNPLSIIEALVPDLLVKGSDYAVDEVIGGDVVTAAGGRVMLADLVPDQSTSNAIRRIQALLPAE